MKQNTRFKDWKKFEAADPALKSMDPKLESIVINNHQTQEDGVFYSSKASGKYNKTEKGAERISLEEALKVCADRSATHIWVEVCFIYSRIKCSALSEWISRPPNIEGCLVSGMPREVFYTRSGSGGFLSTTDDIKLAGRWNATHPTILNTAGNRSLEIWIPSEEKIPDGKTRMCSMEKMLSGSLIDLIKSAPKNPVVRSIVLQKMKKSPPDACDTFEKIKDWIEFNFAAYEWAPNPKSGRGVNFTIEGSDRETGSCSYACHRFGNVEETISEDDILAEAQRALAEGSMESFIDSIHETLRERAASNMECGGGEDYEYDDYEGNASDGLEIDLNISVVKDKITGFLQTYHRDILNQLKEL
jgi:hypothetical protein